MARSKSVSAKKPSTTFKKHAEPARRRSLRRSVTPPSSPSPFVPQRAAVPSNALTLSKTSSDKVEPSGSSSMSGALYGPLSGHDSDIPDERLSENGNVTAEDVGADSEASDAYEPTLPVRNGVYWDTKANGPARPISKPCEETVNPGPLGPRSKCICGEKRGGKRVTTRHAKKWHYQGPKFVFDEERGAYVADTAPAFSTPFHSFEHNGKSICQPITISKEAYLAGKRGSSLSSERTVPQCAHFPITGLTIYNVPFARGNRMSTRAPNAQCLASRVQDQARLLCLIENEVRTDGTVRRRMNVHAPPADWNDPAAISHLNRWRAQFRQRKLGVTSRGKRQKWSEDALNYLVERVARDPSTYRADLAKDITRRFGVERSEHAVSCAIDNHKLRPRAEALRAQWEAEGLWNHFGQGDEDIPMDANVGTDDDDDSSSLSSCSPEPELEVKEENITDEEEEIRDLKMTGWSF